MYPGRHDTIGVEKRMLRDCDRITVSERVATIMSPQEQRRQDLEKDSPLKEKALKLKVSTLSPRMCRRSNKSEGFCSWAIRLPDMGTPGTVAFRVSG
jgi:hypothetical protein